jgi:uncharacterized protein (TIGR02757 family)
MAVPPYPAESRIGPEQTRPRPFMNRDKLDGLYEAYNRREFVHPDPLEFLYHYPALQDREIVALIASSLAYGRVAQILKSVSSVLCRMGPSPVHFVMNSSLESLLAVFSDFKHRFTLGRELAWMLWGARCAIEKHGSLLGCFLAGWNEKESTVLPGLTAFVRAFPTNSGACWAGFLPSPAKGSACKRLNLFMRWMVRQDDVDPGGWGSIPPSKLIVPLDVHMHRISLGFGWTSRKQADLRTAVEVTQAFKKVAPEDPVRYDFALTRLGIRSDMDAAGLPALYAQCETAVSRQTKTEKPSE